MVLLFRRAVPGHLDTLAATPLPGADGLGAPGGQRLPAVFAGKPVQRAVCRTAGTLPTRIDAAVLQESVVAAASAVRGGPVATAGLASHRAANPLSGAERRSNLRQSGGVRCCRRVHSGVRVRAAIDHDLGGFRVIDADSGYCPAESDSRCIQRSGVESGATLRLVAMDRHRYSLARSPVRPGRGTELAYHPSLDARQ